MPLAEQMLVGRTSHSFPGTCLVNTVLTKVVIYFAKGQKALILSMPSAGFLLMKSTKDKGGQFGKKW